MEPDIKTARPQILPGTGVPEKSSSWLGWSILAAAVIFVAFGFYRYQLKPAIARDIPPHIKMPIDEPPLELTSFQVRFGGEDLTPRCLAVSGDSLFASFTQQSLIQIYSSKLELLKSFRLEHPAVVQPTSMLLSDSLLIVADTGLGSIAVFDRDGYYLNSASWYPDHKTRLKPVYLAEQDDFLYTIDLTKRAIAKISLFKKEPFYDFLELIDLIPGGANPTLKLPSCAVVAPNGQLWIGNSEPGGVFLYDLEKGSIREAERPPVTKIGIPSSMVISAVADAGGTTRVHVLDRIAGKVFVYDLEGKLRLVYPRDRDLHAPTSMAIDVLTRHIFVAESETREITVFGF